MQTQQINFYLPEFRPSREALRSVHMIWGLAGMFLVLLALTALTYYQYKQLEAEFAQVNEIQKKLQSQLQDAITARPPLSGPDMDAKIQKLQGELQRRQELESIILSQNLGNDKGFSVQLNALASASLDSISLEAFSLQKGGSYAELVGRARSADQIPLYLQRLRSDPSFSRVGFGVLTVGREEEGNGILQFSLAKADEKAEKSTDKKTAREKLNALSN